MWQKIIEASPYLILIMAFMLVRVLRVFTTHQQKMAEILNRSNGDHAEMASLRKDVAELKVLLQNQILANDDQKRMVPPPIATSVADRLNSG